jgi:hypothetical protein
MMITLNDECFMLLLLVYAVVHDLCYNDDDMMLTMLLKPAAVFETL